jgi:hypothetical protein
MTRLYDRAKMTVSNTPGTGTFLLSMPVANHLSFAAAGVGNGETIPYVAEEAGIGWECGYGTYTASNTSLTRDTVEKSSASGNATFVSFTNAVKVWIDVLASGLIHDGLPSAAFTPNTDTFPMLRGGTLYQASTLDKIRFSNTTEIDGLTPGFVAGSGFGGQWGQRIHVLGGSARLAPLTYQMDVPGNERHRWAINITRNDLDDNHSATTTLDYGLLVEATRGALNLTSINTIRATVDDSSTISPAEPMTAIATLSTRRAGGVGNTFSTVFTFIDESGLTGFAQSEFGAVLAPDIVDPYGTQLHIVVSTDLDSVGNSTLLNAIHINTSPVQEHRKGANILHAILIDEGTSGGATGKVTYPLYFDTNPGAGVGASHYDKGTKGRGLWFEGTYNLGVLDVPGMLTLPSSMKLGVSGASYNIFRGQDNRSITISGGNSGGAGGNITVYGQNHATKASKIELSFGGTLIATIDSTGIDLAAGKVLKINGVTKVS